MKTVLIMDAERDGYTVNQVGDTMTVGDLRNFLNSYPDDMPLFLGFDHRYIYGGIQEDMFHTIRVEEEE